MSAIINLSVGIRSAATPRTSFGIPLILDYSNAQASTAGNPAIGTYSSLAEMLADGWKTYHAAYKEAAALCAQQPRPPVFKVAGMATGVAADDMADIVAEDADWWLLLSTSRTAAQVKALATWVESAESRCFYLACTNDATAKAAGVSVLSEIFAAQRMRTAAMYQLPVLQEVRLHFDKLLVDASVVPLANANTFDCKVNGTSIAQQTFAVSHNATLTAIASALAGTAAVGTATTHASADAPLGSNNDYIKLTAASALVDMLISDIVVAQGVQQAAVRIEEYTASSVPVDAAWAGKVLPYSPGSATWAHKTLAGVTADTLTTAQRGYIQAQRGNWYSTELGFQITFPGTCSKDSSANTPYYIDQVQLADAIESELQTGLMDVLNRSKKIPYTDQGVAMLLAEFKKVEDKYVGTGALVRKTFDDSYTVPSVASQTAGDVSSRIFRGLQARWQTSGGIHVVADFEVSLQA